MGGPKLAGSTSRSWIQSCTFWTLTLEERSGRNDVPSPVSRIFRFVVFLTERNYQPIFLILRISHSRVADPHHPPIFPRGPSQRNCILSEDSGLSRRMGLEPDLESLATPMLLLAKSRASKSLAWIR